MEWVLVDVYVSELSGLKNKQVCCLKLAVEMVGDGIWEFVDYADVPAGGIWSGQVCQNSGLFKLTGGCLCILRASDSFLQYKKIEDCTRGWRICSQ